MQFYAQRMKIIVEPTGCLSLAAARQFGDKLKGKKNWHYYQWWQCRYYAIWSFFITKIIE